MTTLRSKETFSLMEQQQEQQQQQIQTEIPSE